MNDANQMNQFTTLFLFHKDNIVVKCDNVKKFINFGGGKTLE